MALLQPKSTFSVIEITFPPPRSRKRAADLNNDPSTSKKAHLQDHPSQALSVIHDIFDKPEVSAKMMGHFKKSMTPSQAQNVMTWLLSIGDFGDDALSVYIKTSVASDLHRIGGRIAS